MRVEMLIDKETYLIVDVREARTGVHRVEGCEGLESYEFTVPPDASRVEIAKKALIGILS